MRLYLLHYQHGGKVRHNTSIYKPNDESIIGAVIIDKKEEIKIANSHNIKRYCNICKKQESKNETN